MLPDPASLIRTGVICGLQQLLEFGYFHADPHPGNLFALQGRSGDLGHVGYVDFGMMDSISDSDRPRYRCCGASDQPRLHRFGEGFSDAGLLSPTADLTPIVPALEDVLVAASAFRRLVQLQGDHRSLFELMFDYPFRVPARFA